MRTSEAEEYAREIVESFGQNATRSDVREHLEDHMFGDEFDDDDVTQIADLIKTGGAW